MCGRIGFGIGERESAAVEFRQERALRKISILYPRRTVGMKVYEGGSSHLPIKVNPAGVIPAIFASSILLLPTTVSTFSGNSTNPVLSWLAANLGYGQPLHLVLYAALIILFNLFADLIYGWLDPRMREG